MNDQDSSQAVTLADAVNQVKKWAEEKKYEQVKEGCEEILQMEPNNPEIKNLLEQANNALNPKAPAPVAPAPASPTTPATSVPAAPAPSSAPVSAAPAPAAPMPVAPAPAAPATPAPAQNVQLSPEDIFKKTTQSTTQSTKTTTVNSVNVEQAKGLDKLKNENTEKIVTVVVFLALLGGFIYSFMQGWLNPLYDWILGLFGL